MIAQQTECLDKATLDLLLSGKLPNDRFSAALAHVDSCQRCTSLATTASSHAGSPSKALGELRKIDGVPEDELEYEPECQALVANLLVCGAEKAAIGTGGHSYGHPPCQRLGPYRLQSTIGIGGMGAVYLGQHERLRRTVAIKLLPREKADRAGWLDRFNREMTAIAALEHPNVVRALDAGDENDWHYLVMEHLEGLDVSQAARRCGEVGMLAACEVIRQAALGLEAIHLAGLVHRDIKPSNLFLTTDGVVKILDLGLVVGGQSPLVSDGRLTTVGHLMGTLPYMPREQLDDARSADLRSDIYSLGATLFRLLVGKAPFGSGENLAQTIRAISDNQAPVLASVQQELPSGLCQLVDRMLAPTPAERPQSAREVAEALQEYSDASAAKTMIRAAMLEPSAEYVSSAGATELPRPAATDSAPPRRVWRWLAAAGLPLAFVAGIVLMIQTDRGTLLIESDEPAISVRVTQGEKLVERLRVEQGDENSVWLRSGRYRVEIEGAASDAFEISGDDITLLRGEQQVVQVTRRKNKSNAMSYASKPTTGEEPNATWAARDMPGFYQPAGAQPLTPSWLPERTTEVAPHPDAGKVLAQVEAFSTSVVGIPYDALDEADSLVLETAKPDGFLIAHASGRVLRWFGDVDGDQKLDHWMYFRKGMPVFCEIDTSGDRKADLFLIYENKRLVSIGRDEDGDSVVDWGQELSYVPGVSGLPGANSLPGEKASAVSYDVKELPVYLQDGRTQDVELLKRYVRSVVPPDAWSNTDSITYFPANMSISVRTSLPNHRAIRKLLDSLRRPTPKMERRFEDKPLAHWLQVLESDRDMETLAKAMQAVGLLAETPAERLQAAKQMLVPARELGGFILGTRGLTSFNGATPVQTHQDLSGWFMAELVAWFPKTFPLEGLRAIDAELISGTQASQRASLLILAGMNSDLVNEPPAVAFYEQVAAKPEGKELLDALDQSLRSTADTCDGRLRKAGGTQTPESGFDRLAMNIANRNRAAIATARNRELHEDPSIVAWARETVAKQEEGSPLNTGWLSAEEAEMAVRALRGADFQVNAIVQALVLDRPSTANSDRELAAMQQLAKQQPVEVATAIVYTLRTIREGTTQQGHLQRGAFQELTTADTVSQIAVETLQESIPDPIEALVEIAAIQLKGRFSGSFTEEAIDRLLIRTIVEADVENDPDAYARLVYAARGIAMRQSLNAKDAASVFDKLLEARPDSVEPVSVDAVWDPWPKHVDIDFTESSREKVWQRLDVHWYLFSLSSQQPSEAIDFAVKLLSRSEFPLHFFACIPQTDRSMRTFVTNRPATSHQNALWHAGVQQWFEFADTPAGKAKYRELKQALLEAIQRGMRAAENSQTADYFLPLCKWLQLSGDMPDEEPSPVVVEALQTLTDQELREQQLPLRGLLLLGRTSGYSEITAAVLNERAIFPFMDGELTPVELAELVNGVYEESPAAFIKTAGPGAATEGRILRNALREFSSVDHIVTLTEMITTKWLDSADAVSRRRAIDVLKTIAERESLDWDAVLSRLNPKLQVPIER